jgi:hemerythrin-like domain-containing protein
MTFRALMQAGPAKANELFGKLAETSDGAVKTREKLFAELKGELELHVSLEEQHLFPLLRKNAETKELVADAIRDNKELRAKLNELDAMPKNDPAFAETLADLQKTFRQHARDDKKELLPAVQRALSDEQMQGVTEKMEARLAEVEQAKQDEAEERRAKARQEREEAGVPDAPSRTARRAGPWRLSGRRPPPKRVPVNALASWLTRPSGRPLRPPGRWPTAPVPLPPVPRRASVPRLRPRP